MKAYSLILLAISAFLVNAKSIEHKCSTEDFFKTFGCIGELTEFLSTVEKFDLKKETERNSFTAMCNLAASCFNNIDCLHSDRLKKFLQTFCSYSVFIETDFKNCNDKLNARNGTTCEKTFKKYFGNDIPDDVKCQKLDDSLLCIKEEVTEICGDIDSNKMQKYLVDMSESLACKDIIGNSTIV